MDADAFNMSIRKFLKTVGVNSQLAIEKAVRKAIEDGKLKGSESLPVAMTLSVGALALEVKFDGDLVVFKAELAIVTRRTTQVQGVWVHPEYRGNGLATNAMAAVVADALRRVAPTVSLYVNDYNAPARRVYANCGFISAGSFATVLF